MSSGTTYFDGIIDPEFFPVGGVTAAHLDSGLFGEATLNIQLGGNLILADPRITGDRRRTTARLMPSSTR
jgi:hypothetical protein